MIGRLLFLFFPRLFLSLLEMCVNNGRHNDLNRDKRQWVKETEPKMKFDNETIIPLEFSIGKFGTAFR